MFKISAAIPPVATPELKILRNNSGKCSRICGTCATPKPKPKEIAIISKARRSKTTPERMLIPEAATAPKRSFTQTI